MKEQVYRSLLNLLEQKIKNAQQSIHSIQESRNNETKSSAGDKYETARAMMQSELEKEAQVLHQLLQQQNEVQKIKKLKKSKTIGFGSFVETNIGNYFIAVGVGKLENAFVISLVSPLGKALMGHKKGELVKFQNRTFKIKNVQ